jgi:hypothetical protein
MLDLEFYEYFEDKTLKEIVDTLIEEERIEIVPLILESVVNIHPLTLKRFFTKLVYKQFTYIPFNVVYSPHPERFYQKPGNYPFPLELCYVPIEDHIVSVSRGSYGVHKAQFPISSELKQILQKRTEEMNFFRGGILFLLVYFKTQGKYPSRRFIELHHTLNPIKKVVWE